MGACPGHRGGSLGGDIAEIAESQCHPSPRGPQNPPSPVAGQVSSASRCFFREFWAKTLSGPCRRWPPTLIRH